MKKTFLTVSIVILVLLGSDIKDSNIRTDSQITIVKNVTVFTGEKYIENTNVVFDSNNIIAITKKIDGYKTATIIDGAGKTIIPPLMNAHVHIWSPEGLKESLKVGIFANLEMHTTDEAANFLRTYNDSLGFSKYYSSNAAATVPGGHGTQFGIQVPTINDEVSPEKFVQDRVAAHADYIKVIKEPLWATLSEQQTLGVIREAHRNNVLAVGHSHLLEESITLTEQGIDGLVHIWFDKKTDEGTLKKMKDSNIFIVPTILVTDTLLELRKNAGRGENDLETEDVLKEIKKTHDLGIPILSGTDAPNMQFNYSDKLFDEMELLKKAGLTNTDVLKSATTNIYNVFSLDGFEELKKGSSPNFILIDGNPVLKLEDIRNKKAIYKQGQVVYSDY